MAVMVVTVTVVGSNNWHKGIFIHAIIVFAII